MENFDLERFLDAQATTYDTAIAELRAGQKRSHWMWFIFPQMKGLGRSSTASYYGITSLAEAQAYLGDPILGPRLLESTRLVTVSTARSLHALFGSPDDLKFGSSMTLFEKAALVNDNPFADALERWCGGARDQATLSLLHRGSK